MKSETSVTVSAVLLLPIMLIVDQPWSLPVPVWTVLALAYWIFFRVLATAGATNIPLAGMRVPLTAPDLKIMLTR
jgi:hypothetical protein